MARGPSGKIIADIGAELKLRLHSVLAAQGSNCKAWLIRQAQDYCNEFEQPSLKIKAPRAWKKLPKNNKTSP
jgi:hypothetical protein